MLIKINYQIIMILWDSVLLGGFELGDKVLDLFSADEIFVEL